tara:strand:- start:14190 stop:14786 length:597 start_codon:yes stop_codon:yes gene_type:complete
MECLFKMDIRLDVKSLRETPAFLSPMRVGVFVHLAAHVEPGSMVLEMSPGVFAERLDSTRARVEAAIIGLARHGAISLEKGKTKRGVWFIDMTPSASLLTGQWSEDAPKEIPYRELNALWDKEHLDATGSSYLRTRADYWRERNDWATLWDSLGDKLYKAIPLFFRDKENARWGYRFTVFFRKASALVDRPASSWRMG